jgi:oxepin-CoA hydrolase/3-oxo-5,6-dehydrosuberyl-CoA semialdehyde dehydrogenase
MIAHYVGGRWHTPNDEGSVHRDATTGCEIFRVSTAPADLTAALGYARSVGLPALAAVSRQQRARQLREIARRVERDRAALATAAGSLGATPADAADDIDGGIAALRHHAAAVAGELPDTDAPDDRILIFEAASTITGGELVAQPMAADRPGVALHINGFSLPVSTLLTQFAKAHLAGLPSIFRPSGRTAQLVARLVELVVAAGAVPEGTLQLLCGPIPFPDVFTAQDLVSFTGTRDTATRLRARIHQLSPEPRLEVAAEPLNCAVLGPDAAAGDPACRLFVERLAAAMTSHTGQRAAAARRAFVPAHLFDQVADAVAAELAHVRTGHPGDPAVRMGPLVDLAHREAVRRRVATLSGAAATIFGDPHRVDVVGGDPVLGAFISPILLAARAEADPRALHTVEAFGPVSALIPYRTADEITAGLALGRDGLHSWLVTEDPLVARDLVRALAPWHARLRVVGPGAPRAGGTGLGAAECLRQLRDRLAPMVLEASPTVSRAVTDRWVRGGERVFGDTNPLRRHLDELRVGDALVTGSRVVTRSDIDRFTQLTGDRFYAHADEAAAARNPILRGIVAHGSLVIGLATGLFATADPGPVLANRGVENLVFLAPVRPGDELTATVTVKAITPRPNAEHGDVRWDVEVVNQHGLPVVRYDLLALTARNPAARSPAAVRDRPANQASRQRDSTPLRSNTSDTEEQAC